MSHMNVDVSHIFTVLVMTFGTDGIFGLHFYGGTISALTFLSS